MQAVRPRGASHSSRREDAGRRGSALPLVAVCLAGGVALGLVGLTLTSSPGGSGGSGGGRRGGGSGPSAGATGRAEWDARAEASGDIVEYAGRLVLKKVEGSLSATFPAAGSWTVVFSDARDGLAFMGTVEADETQVLGAAGNWLRPGRNPVRATFQGNGAAGPPVLEVLDGAAGPP